MKQLVISIDCIYYLAVDYQTTDERAHVLLLLQKVREMTLIVFLGNGLSRRFQNFWQFQNDMELTEWKKLINFHFIILPVDVMSF